MKITAVPPCRILLVDDSHDGLVVRRALLEEFGYCVQVAATPQEGLKLFEASNFDVVVTDYRMPDMDGVELIRRMRSFKPQMRVILLSGFVESLDLTEENTRADLVVAKSSREAVHLVRGVKRLMSATPARKPPGKQNPPPKARAAAT